MHKGYCSTYFPVQEPTCETDFDELVSHVQFKQLYVYIKILLITA